MKVEVTVELDVNLSKVKLADVKSLAERLIAPNQVEAVESVRILDVRLKDKDSGSGGGQ
ncbi:MULTISPECIES: hypothetical protein [Ectothiorhodospira]|uniref:hypothetical protein n=1 Tax=Ectothiorhodospira TaxID=1051 RepID=UPI0004B456C3|nr:MULTISPECIES: hypothetical protein [Ectothiorhodospira]MCG5493896.1 hypothetical protein [Ectothiorhodospira variabilis]MCG5498110.1 hypothetical protein [Ectothiorhodospira variabilis]MCG5503699.1 hypothetical protein [Ectothiorhodospira variabilis]MCG5506855.1 hypothetical protein [Ectothiorhodospira variabilis]MCG5524697.1 hypothetical protein [Ectothiorhodospira haloalkaliphila]